MAAYISVTFEKARLVTSEQVRVIIRNRDDGDVPPQPSVSYYPTQPADLQNFIVGQYINSASGDMFSRIAVVADLNTITVRELDTFRDLAVNFTTAGVQPGDLLEVYLTDPELWTSDVYSDTTPHIFQIASVSSTQITVTKPFPAYSNGSSWSIPARSLTGVAGFTQRNGLPANGTYFRDSRYQRLYATVVEAENSVVAMKADITGLTNESAGEGLDSETVTLSSTI